MYLRIIYEVKRGHIFLILIHIALISCLMIQYEIVVTLLQIYGNTCDVLHCNWDVFEKKTRNMLVYKQKTTVPLKITDIIVRCITYVNMVYHNYTEYIFFIVRV